MKQPATPEQQHVCLIRYLEWLRDNTHNLFVHTPELWRDHYESQIVDFKQPFESARKKV